MLICGPSQAVATRHTQACTGPLSHAPCLTIAYHRHRSSAQPIASTSASSASLSPLAHRTQLPRTQQRCQAASTEQAPVLADFQVSKAAAAAIQYALEFARASETYEVNSWMLLLGILKQEESTAAKTLRAMGLDDLYGAWHEVLWALNVCDALEPKPPVPEIGFADRAYHVLVGAGNFAEWGGRKKVQSEDLLMALAAGAVLEGLFPDINPTFGRVRKAVEEQAGGVYVLPDDDGASPAAVKSVDDIFSS